MKVTAVIPVRKGSERVVDKCIRPFGDTSLLQYKIDVLKQVAELDEIVVNTDSDEAIEIAIKNNIQYHRREAFYASSDCPANEYFYYLGKTTEADLVAYTPVTAPFITKETFSHCISTFDNAPNASVVTASLIKEFLWRKDAPLNFTLDRHPKSQDLNDISAINFGLCLLSRETLVNYKSIIGPKPSIYITSHIEGIDIDTPLDFFIAEQIYGRMKAGHDNLLQ